MMNALILSVSLLLAPLLFVGAALASAHSSVRPCTSELEHVLAGQISYTRRLVRATGHCMVVMSGFRDAYWNTRSLYWNGNGDMTVIVGWNEEDPEKSALYVRGFALFPRGMTEPDFKTLADHSVSLVHANGESFALSPQGRLVSYTGGQLRLSQDDRLDLNDRGGIEILPSSGVILDYGWRKNGHPKDQPSRVSTFRDSHGKRCEIINREFLKPIYTPAGKVDEYENRFKTDLELADFLEGKCPELDTSSLR